MLSLARTAGTLGILIPPSITWLSMQSPPSIDHSRLLGASSGFLLMCFFGSIFLGPREPDFDSKRRPCTNADRETSQIARAHSVHCSDPVHSVRASGGARDSDRVRSVWCAGLAGHRVVGRIADVVELCREPARYDARVVHDHVYSRGRVVLSKAMAFTGLPRELAEWVGSLALNPYALIAILSIFYVILGTALDGISMIVLTAAVVLPMIQAAGFDLVWFGIFIVLLVEIAEVTPPVGFNLFVLQNMTGKDSNTIALASLPFFAMLLVAIALLTVFPEIATWLPDLVMGKQT